MNAFFEDGDGDVPGQWSGESPDAWKKGSLNGSTGISAYGGRAPLKGDSDIEFQINDFHGSDILRGEIQAVYDVLDILTRGKTVEKKPFFAFNSLALAREDLGKIRDSPYCRDARDRDVILKELGLIDRDITRLMNGAYHRLEF